MNAPAVSAGAFRSLRNLLQGATVISYVHGGQERLFVSKKADLSPSTSNAIRGGVPICWPVFGPPPADNAIYANLKQHGFARNSVWSFDQAQSRESPEGVKAVFSSFYSRPHFSSQTE